MSDDESRQWQPIDTAPSDQEILVYTRSWGPIVASYSEEFGEWLSRMQVPVSIKDEEELPTHWQPLPPAPDDVQAYGASRGDRTVDASRTGSAEEAA